jgi:hypothetical protein
MAANYGRSAVLRAVAADTGTILGQATLPDVTAVLLLRYDEATGQALIAPQGGDPSLPEIQYWDLASGTKVRQVPIASDGVASVSPDGHYLLTASAAAATSAVAGRMPARSTSMTWPPTSRPRKRWPSRRHPLVAHVWAPGSDGWPICCEMACLL